MSRPEGIEPAEAILLRDTVAEDVPVFFDQRLDADANYMAAFTSKAPAMAPRRSEAGSRVL